MSKPETTSTLTKTDFSIVEGQGAGSGSWNICPTIDPTSLIGPGRGAIFMYDACVFEEDAPIESGFQMPPAEGRWGELGVSPLELSSELRERFRDLAARWKSDVRFLSDTNEICGHAAYQEIIGMGARALPFILAELETDPDHWFWALKAITGADPVPDEHRGNLDLMARDWLSWAQAYQSRLLSELQGLFARRAC
jgi:hypothetical protein